MNSLPYNVALLPSDELTARAIADSNKLEQLGTLFTLQIGKYYPHVSVYMLQLKTSDTPRVEELLAEIAAYTTKLDLRATRYYHTKNYFDAEYQKTEQIAGLQRAVVSALNSIRDGMRENDKARVPEATGLALENFKKFGWNSIGELYRPHLTLTRFNDEQIEPEKLLADVREFNGEFPKIGLFETGDNGTCVRKVAEFELSGSNP